MAAPVWVTAYFSACRVVGRYLYTFTFKCPQRKNSEGDQSGDLWCQVMSPGKGRRHPGNNYLCFPSERR
ncbi:hypothetical protein TNCV_4331631 [Trichonephila clavipes]|nr:hypothetical protein TNCV_4331631 [Trichonephila clavipes]